MNGEKIMVFCNNCGEPLKEGAKFCTNCGKHLTTPEPQKIQPVITRSEPLTPTQDEDVTTQAISHVASTTSVEIPQNICKKCKKQIKSRATKFCPHCGCDDPLEINKPKIITCMNCNYEFDDPDTEFCPNCGRPVELTSEQSFGYSEKVLETPPMNEPQISIESKDIVTSTPLAVSPPTEEKRRCGGCGKPLSPSVSFCTECGRPVTFSLQQSHTNEMSEPNQAENNAVTPTQQPAPSQHVSQQFRFCNRCEAKMATGKKFCTQCGAPMS